MKKKDTLDRRLGPTIREIGNRHGLSVTNLKSALAESFNDRRKGWADENVEYGEETIGGYLYDRTWPDMECQTCIDIVTAAFESAVLSDRTNENAIRKGQQQVKSEIERLYREYERKAYLDTYTQEISVETLRASMLHMEPTIAQILLDNLAACKSLDSYDIAFRKAISTFEDDRIRHITEAINQRKLSFLVGELNHKLFSPDLFQWLAIWNRGRSKISKSAERISQLAEKQARELEWNEDSFQSMFAVVTHITGDGIPKSPIYRREELNLLLLFKYCLDAEQKASVLRDYRV